MAKGTGRAGSSDKMVNTIIAAVMIAVIGLSAYAVYDTMSSKIINTQIQNGEREATLEYMAENAGLSVNEFLEQYGIADAGLSKKSTQTEVIDKMTLTKYAEYSSTTVEDLLKQYYLEDKATGDTTYADFKAMWTVKAMVAGDEEQLKQMKEYYSLDDSVTMDTLWSEVEPVIEAKIEEMQNATPAPTEETPVEGEATEAPAEEATAAPEAEATAAPAE